MFIGPNMKVSVLRKAPEEEECDIPRAAQLVGMSKERLLEELAKNDGKFENEFWLVWAS
jgi:hypothetical protein